MSQTFNKLFKPHNLARTIALTLSLSLGLTGLTACTQAEDKPAEQVISPTNSSENEQSNESPMIASDDELSALDTELNATIFGNFVGDFPCPHPNCDIHRTTLLLNPDGSLTKTIADVQQNKIEIHYSLTGQYSQQDDVITAHYHLANTQENPHHHHEQESVALTEVEYYQVEGNQLVLLNEDKTPLTDSEANRYVLSQQ